MNKKFLLAVVATMLCVAAINAQDKVMEGKKTSLGIAINAGVPTAASSISFVSGADLQADIATSKDLNFTLSAGYENYSNKSAYQSYVGKSTGLIPLLAGLKYYFSPKFYGHAQIGYAFSTSGGGGSHFAYAPSIGFNITPKVDIGAKFLGLSGGVDAILARIAYHF